MRLRLVALLALSLTAAACSGGGGGGGGGDDDDDGASPDLDGGTWVVADLTVSSGTISHDGRVAFTPDGVAWAAWSEPEFDSTSDQDIWSGDDGGSGDWSAERRTDDTAVQNAFPSITVTGSTVHLVYNGYPGGDNDVFHTKNGGSGWSAPVDLNSTEEGGNLRTDYAPAIAADVNGDVTIAYASHPINGGGNQTGPSEIRVIRIPAGGSPSAPEVAIPDQGGSSCFDPDLIFDASGVLWVAADCGGADTEDIFVAHDQLGSFAAAALPTNSGQTDFNVRFAKSSDGAVLHLIWIGSVSCASGNCAKVQYSSNAGGSFQSAIRVTGNQDDGDEYAAAIAVDPFDRVLVTFHRFNADSYGDVFFTWSEDGASFSAPRNLTPGTETTDEWFPESIAIHPLTNRPHVVFERIVAGSDPLNTEIVEARLDP